MKRQIKPAEDEEQILAFIRHQAPEKTFIKLNAGVFTNDVKKTLQSFEKIIIAKNAGQLVYNNSIEICRKLIENINDLIPE